MPSYKTYTVEQYTAFLLQDFNNNFGMTENEVADWFMSQNGAQPVIRKYGVTKANLLSDYIPLLKSSFNGGYFIFLAITVTEGGGAGNWLNHEVYDYSGVGLTDMQYDINYVNSLNKSYPPAMSDPYGGIPTYVEDIPGQTNEVYQKTPAQSIGQYFMPSTMAGNAWVFGEQWCLANQPSPVYFGNPYDQIIEVIKASGADPFDGSGGNGVQLAVFPFKEDIILTQGENGQWSHMGCLAMDFAKATPKVPYYAPCDVVCVAVDSWAFVTWQSVKNVRWANGNESIISFWCGHDDDYASFSVGQTLKKGELMGHTGTAGNVTGDHLHLEVAQGEYAGGFYNSQGVYQIVNSVHIADVFSICDNVNKTRVTITDGGGTGVYPWTCVMDYEDGESGGGIPNPPEPQPKAEFSVMEVRRLPINQTKEFETDDLVQSLYNEINLLMFGNIIEEAEPQLLNSEFSSISLYDNFGNMFDYQPEYIEQNKKQTLVVSGAIGDSNKVHYTFKSYKLFKEDNEVIKYNYGIMDSTTRTVTVITDKTDEFMQANTNQVEAQSRSFNENKDMLKKSISLSEKGVNLANEQATFNSNFAIAKSGLNLGQTGFNAITGVIGSALSGNPLNIVNSSANGVFNTANAGMNLYNSVKQGEFTEENNNMRTQQNNLSNMQAKLSLNQNIRAYNASIKDIDNQPSSVQQIGSDMSFISGNRLDKMLIAYSSGNKELLHIANNYFKAYGIVQNKMYEDIRVIFEQRELFNYIKCSNINLIGLGINISHLNSLKSIFISGTRVWNYKKNITEARFLDLTGENKDL